jgi:hypothetical protein
MQQDQVALATADGDMTTTLMHEISHGIGPELSGLEEAKADIVGLYGLKWLADHGKFPAAKLAECPVSEVAGIFRTVRFGVAEAHGRAEIMEFNFLTERGSIRVDGASGRYAVEIARMPDAIAALAKELLEQEATGDRAPGIARASTPGSPDTAPCRHPSPTPSTRFATSRWMSTRRRTFLNCDEAP